MFASQPPVPPPSPPRFGPSHWDPLVIALAGMMCTFFLILSFRKIIQRHCNDFIPTRLSRNSGRRQMLIDGIILDDPSLQFQSRGLDSFVMHSLPITQFQKKKEKEEVIAEENMECTICLGEFEDGEWLKHLSNCSHVFHVSCVDTWFQTHSSCPVCRSYVYPETSHETSVSVEDLLERREEINRNSPRNFQVLRTHLLQSSPIRLEILQVHDVHHLR